jgi:hypothetical protein
LIARLAHTSSLFERIEQIIAKRGRWLECSLSA